MKKECERTRKVFPRYLRGHVFRTERIRIDRHLASCVICRSEFEGLKRADETRRILKDINMSEGVIPVVKNGVASLSGLKKILYRPLWLAAIVLAAAGIYHYAMTPRQLDLEIEKIVQTEPATTPAVQPEELKPKTEMNVVSTPAASVPAPQPPSAPPAPPLVVNIIPDNETAAVRRINEVMREQGHLRKVKFSETNREAAGTLSAGELQAFLDRIEAVARVKFNRKRLESFPNAQPIPFTLKLQAAPKTVERPPLSLKPVQRPEPTPTQAPAETAIPAAPATGPTPSAVE
jgi:hypothetical protein